MSLPKLSRPTFETTIPSTKERITFMPFTTGEEKTLLIANETKKERDILRAMLDAVQRCVVTENFNANTLTMTDLEYLFMMVRSKSAGETAELMVSCKNEKCSEIIRFHIDFENDIEITKSDTKKQFDLTNDLKLEVRIPSVHAVLQSKALDDFRSDVEKSFDMLELTLHMVVQGDEIHRFEDHTPEEISTFVNEMTADQLSKITSFVEQRPVMHYEKLIKCGQCGTTQKISIKSLSDFFTYSSPTQASGDTTL